VTLAIIPAPQELLPRIVLLALGIVLNAVAFAAYVGSRLGPGPRDGMVTGFCRRTGISLRVTRTMVELLVLGTGWGAVIVTAVVVAAAGLTGGDPDRTWWVVALLFGLGILVGLVNGIVTTRLLVPSFITTLGMLLVLRGAVLYWSGGAPKGSLPENFRVFGRRGIEDLPVVEQLPYSVIILIVVGIAAVLLLHRTTFGKQLFAAGGNPRAAVLSGVDVPLVRTLAFVLSGISAVIAGILVGGFAGISQDAGAGYEFQAISAVVLGGAVLGGGRGSMVAAMAGALALEALFTLLNLLGLPKPLRDAVQGLIIIGAVAYAAYRLRRAR